MMQIEVTVLASKGNCTAAYHTRGAAAVTELRRGAKKQRQLHAGRNPRLLWEKCITQVTECLLPGTSYKPEGWGTQVTHCSSRLAADLLEAVLQETTLNWSLAASRSCST